MKIAFFYESLALGGQQTQTLQLLQRLARRGHDVSWIYLSGDDLRPQVEACGRAIQIDVPLPPGAYRRAPWRVVQIAARLRGLFLRDQTTVVVSGSGLGSLMAGVAARLSGTRHFRLVGCGLAQVEPTLLAWYRRLQIDRGIDGYFGWPAVFRELESVGVSASKCIDLNNAVDTDLFRPDADAGRAVRTRLGIPADRFVIGWIGRISPDMQVGNTIDAARGLLDRGIEDFTVLVVGGGPWLEGLRARVAQMGLQTHVVFTGWVPMTDVPGYVNAMDVVPLLEPDPQGGSIVREAMACGRVAMSVDGAGGTQRRFMTPDCTWLVAPERWASDAVDALATLKADPALRARLGAAAARYARESMSFEQQVETLLEAFARGDAGRPVLER